MKDLYSEIANNLIAQLDAGIIPWRQPWTGLSDGPISHVTGRPYSLINQFLLRDPGEYLTFNQCKAEGGRVKKGAKARMIVFWKSVKTIDVDDEGNEKATFHPFLKYYQVFHINDCEGITPRVKAPATRPDPIPAAEKALNDYIEREGINFEQCISMDAYYSPRSDIIHLPLVEQFDNAPEYYSTAFHEAAHSTGHYKRLNRFELNAPVAAFGSESYSKEELVAEIASATILHTLGIETPQSFKNSAAYCQSWLRALKNDNRLIVTAAARADKAAKFILNLNDTDPEAVED